MQFKLTTLLAFVVAAVAIPVPQDAVPTTSTTSSTALPTGSGTAGAPGVPFPPSFDSGFIPSFGGSGSDQTLPSGFGKRHDDSFAEGEYENTPTPCSDSEAEAASTDASSEDQSSETVVAQPEVTEPAEVASEASDAYGAEGQTTSLDSEVAQETPTTGGYETQPSILPASEGTSETNIPSEYGSKGELPPQGATGETGGDCEESTEGETSEGESTQSSSVVAQPAQESGVSEETTEASSVVEQPAQETASDYESVDTAQPTDSSVASEATYSPEAGAGDASEGAESVGTPEGEAYTEGSTATATGSAASEATPCDCEESDEAY